MWHGKPADIAIIRDISERKSREERLQQYCKRLEILNKTERDILGLLPPEEIGQTAVRDLRALIPCLTACLMTIDFEGRTLSVLCADASFPPELKEEASLPLSEFKYILEHVDTLLLGEVVKIQDIKERAFLPPLYEYFQSQGVTACVLVPLLVKNDLIGLLCLGFDRLEGFEREYYYIVREVADAVAIAIQNSRLFSSINDHREQLQSLSIRLSEVDESLRRRLSQELHDRVGQNLTALSINMNIIRSRLSSGSARKEASRFDDSQRLIEETMERIRDIMSELRPEALDEYGLPAALRWYVKRFSERTGMRVKVDAEELTQRLSVSQETALFRIAQEALTNAVRHSETDKAEVILKQTDGILRLTVADKGVGFDDRIGIHQGDHKSWGLIIMQERAQAVGARIRLVTAHGSGTRVIVELNRKGS